jgi:molecular chaperone DnaK
VLKGDVSGILLLDVTPLSLGVETEGGVTNVMIERNTTIPTRRAEIYTTAADNQPEVEIHVLQGERSMAADNNSLGRFKLPGIVPAPRGVPQIEVTFDIDANGIVSVSAKDLGTGKSQSVTITGGTALSKEEIETMVHDAEAHANEDKERREAAEAHNQADQLVHSITKQLEEHGDKLTDDERSPIDEAIENLKSLLEDKEAATDELRKQTEALLTTSQTLGQKIYEASQAEAEGDAADESDDDDVVEAEIVEEDEGDGQEGDGA